MAQPKNSEHHANAFLARVWPVISDRPSRQQRFIASVAADLAGEIAVGNLNPAAAWATLKGVWSGNIPP